MPKQNQIRLRMDFEHQPVLDVKKNIKGPADLDSLFDDLRLKLFGK